MIQKTTFLQHQNRKIVVDKMMIKKNIFENIHFSTLDSRVRGFRSSVLLCINCLIPVSIVRLIFLSVVSRTKFFTIFYVKLRSRDEK